MPLGIGSKCKIYEIEMQTNLVIKGKWIPYLMRGEEEKIRLNIQDLSFKFLGVLCCVVVALVVLGSHPVLRVYS